MDPIATARYGMLNATQRMEASANVVAAMGDGPDLDMGHEVVQLGQAKHQFTASVEVVRIAEEMWRDLLDLQARNR